MILGANLLYPDTWSTFRPWRDEVRQAEPLWTGNWHERKPVRVPSNLQARAVVGDAGAMRPGNYRAHEAHGRCSLQGDINQGTVGTDAVWIEGPADPLALAPALFDADFGHFKAEFRESLAPFASMVRVMDWCKPGGAMRSIDEIRRSGGSATAIPLQETGLDGLSPEVGIRPQFFQELPLAGCKRVWLNMPLRVAASQVEAIRWIQAYVPPGVEVFVTIGNELWNQDPRFVATHYLQRIAKAIWPTVPPMLGACHLLLKALIQLKVWLAADPRFTVIFEWWNANRWPLLQGEWGADFARAAVRELGHVAVAPYWGHNCTEATQLGESMDQPVEDLERWATLCRELGATLHLYEYGPELPQPVTIPPDALARAETAFLERIRPHVSGYACRYALAGQQWGAERRLGDRGPVYEALATAAQVTT